MSRPSRPTDGQSRPETAAAGRGDQRQRSGPVRLLVLLGFPAVLAAGCLLLYHLDPVAGRGLMPCLFYQLTGINCIGCGTTRALHALLHGDLAAAASYNIFMLVWLPLPAYALLAEWLRALAGRPLLPAIRDWRWLMIVLAGSAILFFILRNLPWAPFNWLAA
jgi:hypothetical protein